jgi:hypothetical protein
MTIVTGWGQPDLLIPTVSASGTVEVAGTGAPSCPVPTIEAVGAAEVTGTGTPSLPVPTASGAGAAEVTGTGAISLPAVEASGSSVGEVTGTGAISLPAVTAASGKRYSMTIEHAPQSMSDDMAKVAEVFDLTYFTEFRDKLPFDLTLKTDYQRFSCAVPYDENVSVINNQAEAGQPYFRHMILLVPKVGLWGSIMEVKVVKEIPANGLSKCFGYLCNIIPRPGMGKEFIAGSDAIANGW